MGLNAVLVDRARRIRRLAEGLRVEGSAGFSDAAGPWFRCRLDPPSFVPEQATPGAPLRTLPNPSLTFLPLAPNIAPMATDRVEVDSAELGRAVYEVTGEAEVWRKKRKVIGYRLQLRRVEEHPAAAVTVGGSGGSGAPVGLAAGSVLIEPSDEAVVVTPTEDGLVLAPLTPSEPDPDVFPRPPRRRR